MPELIKLLQKHPWLGRHNTWTALPPIIVIVNVTLQWGKCGRVRPQWFVYTCHFLPDRKWYNLPCLLCLNVNDAPLKKPNRYSYINSLLSYTFFRSMKIWEALYEIFMTLWFIVCFVVRKGWCQGKFAHVARRKGNSWTERFWAIPCQINNISGKPPSVTFLNLHWTKL